MSNNLNPQPNDQHQPQHNEKYSPKLTPKQDPQQELDEIITTLKTLYDKYIDNDFVRSKLVYHVKTTLPNFLQQKSDVRVQREERRKTLEETSDEFIREFINSSSYYYNPNIDLFFVYHHTTYKIINEDDIEHDIRTTITDQQNTELSIWKYKIKNQIIKKIKERDLLSSTPESETIQRVLGALTPFVFKNKDSAKYFLTIIGDILLKKNTNTYFISNKVKQFISELSDESYALFGTPNMSTHFKYKFYEHKYEECRLIDIVDNVISFPFYNHNEGLKLCHSLSSSSLSSMAGLSNSGMSTPTGQHNYGHGLHGNSHMHNNNHAHNTNTIQKQSMIDLLCVAAHYSTRFGNADTFIEKVCKDRNIKEHSFYLKNITEDEILTRFITSTTEPCKGIHITWKNMLYLWKIFIEEEKIPNVFFTSVLKKHLMKRLDVSGTGTNESADVVDAPDATDTHDAPETQEIFLNITSKHLPLVSKFMSFWNENITCNQAEIELEIDELSTLFLNFGNVYHGNQKNVQTINDQTILGFIKHFLPDICIEEDKYLMNIGCKLWDKKQEILNAVEEFKKANLRIVESKESIESKETNVPISGKGKNNKNKDVNTIVSNSNNNNNNNNIIVSPPKHILPASFPVHTIYDFYCKWGYKHNKMVVSKRYFEKFFIDNYGESLIEKNGILWWNN